ncbi:hypothetical protein C6B28_28665 [Escherichia coli]|nr:hypothetical protein C6B28_28665 [Escherichia coli]
MPAFEWVHVQLHQQKGMISLSPPTICNSAGKYYTQGDKVLMPLAIQVHHAVCDGFHVGRMLNELQQYCDEWQGGA